MSGTSLTGVGGTGTSSSGAASAASGARTKVTGGELGQDAFFKILIAQLKSQNPLDPMDPGDFMAQLAILTQTERIVELQQDFERFLNLAGIQNAPSLIGRVAVFDDATGAEQMKVIASVIVKDGKFSFRLQDDTVISSDQVKEIG